LCRTIETFTTRVEKIYLALGRVDEALADLDQAIDLGIEGIGTLYARGRIHELKGELAAAITDHRSAIDAALTNELSNARVESVNTTLRLLTRIAFGFRSPDALIGLAMLSLGGCCPPLPARSHTPYSAYRPARCRICRSIWCFPG